MQNDKSQNVKIIVDKSTTPIIIRIKKNIGYDIIPGSDSIK